MTNVQAALNNTLRHFISATQRACMAELLKSEEAAFFAEKIRELNDIVTHMPLPYETDGQGGRAIAHLHYFKGACDWWITERDSSEEQIQSFGRADLGYGPELGYISIKELIENGVELDLHWTPKPLRDCG